MPKQRYWDANVFLGWFKDEIDKADKCRGIVKLAEEGELIIATSALTLTEVIKLKKHTPLERKDEEKIRRFFEQEYIAVRVVDRIIAEQARQLIWEHNIDPKDAIHLATAIKLKIPVMDTFDDQLIKLSGKYGKPPLKIGHPNIAVQESLNFDKQTEKN